MKELILFYNKGQGKFAKQIIKSYQDYEVTEFITVDNSQVISLYNVDVSKLPVAILIENEEEVIRINY